MTNRVLHIPAKSLNEARVIAHAVDAGRVPCLGQYLDAERAEVAAGAMSATHRVEHAVYPIIMVDGVSDDGRIRVAKLADEIGQVLAAFLIVIGGSYLVGLGSLL